MAAVLRACALTLLVLVVVGAVGAADPVSPSEYVRLVCGGFSEFQGAVQRRGEQARSALQSGARGGEGKRRLGSFFDGVVADADRLVASLRAAGVPDVARGQDVADTLTMVTGRLRQVLIDARDRTNHLPEDSEQFRPAAQALLASIHSAFPGIAEGLRQFETHEDLDRAGKREPACQRLGS
ncbi:MAG TPA: hypothetical protein VGM22_23710 [Methylomirabilota bacterium]